MLDESALLIFKMAPTLEEARAATHRRDWHLILGLSPPFAERDVQKARRELQRHAHQDKGGNPELSALINKAADELLARMRPLERPRRQEQERREEREEEQRRVEAERQKRVDEYWQKAHRAQLERRARSHNDAVWLAASRGSGKRKTAYLSIHAGIAFPTIRKRMWKLHERHEGSVRARALSYAVEAEIAARRAAREEQWPRTVGLDKRQPEKSLALKALKWQYDKAYEQLRQLRKTRKLRQHAVLATKRLLGEAWMILLAAPAPLPSGSPIAL